MIYFLNKTLNIVNKSLLQKNIKTNIYLIVLNIIYYSLLKDINTINIRKIEEEIAKLIIIFNEIEYLDDIFELKLYFYINGKDKYILKEFIKTIKYYENNNNNKIYVLIQIKKLKRLILKDKLWCSNLGVSILF